MATGFGAGNNGTSMKFAIAYIRASMLQRPEVRYDHAGAETLCLRAGNKLLKFNLQ